MDDDDTLVARVAAGDDGALRELFFRHAPLLGSRLRRVLPASDVEDVLQETFLAAWRGAARYRAQGMAGGWLWSIARRQAALLLRRRGPASVELTAEPPAIADEADAAMTRAELGQAVAALDPATLGYYPGFTVAEFVEYFALLKDMPPGRVPRAVAAAIERVDLGGRARSKLRTLSGGMLRRAGIAQAIVNEPSLLLLDEPTAGLDPEQRVQFRALLRSLGEQATVVVSTHLVEDVGAACTDVAVMDAGRVVFRGTPAELITRGTSEDTGDAPLERGYTAVLAQARQLAKARP